MPVYYYYYDSAINLIICCNVADSISDVDCFTLQMDAPHICCEPDTGNFCQIQCNNGFCRCVDPLTGEPTIDFTFPDNDESISCDLIISEYAL